MRQMYRQDILNVRTDVISAKPTVTAKVKLSAKFDKRTSNFYLTILIDIKFENDLLNSDVHHITRGTTH